MCLERILVYAAQHADDAISYDGELNAYPDSDWSDHEMVAYSDSDWSEGHGTLGGCLKLAKGLIHWFSRRQQCITMSSTESEIMAASETALEVVYHRRLLSELGLPQRKPTKLYVDNQGAVELSKDQKSCHRSRHVLRRYFKVRELQHDGVVEVVWVATDDNLADGFTK